LLIIILAIRSCCTWYNRHLEQSGIKVLLLTNDSECKKKALQEGLIAFTRWKIILYLKCRVFIIFFVVQEYVDLLTEAPDLQDLLLTPAESCEAERHPLDL
jgi:DTW domain-containing protein YfiP